MNNQVKSEKFLDESIQAQIQNLSSMLDKSILTDNQNKIFFDNPTQTEIVSLKIKHKNIFLLDEGNF